MSSDAFLPDAAGNPAYYVRMRGKIHGPFDVEKLKKMYARGQFSRAHEVSQDKRSWQPAGTLTELFSAPEKRVPQAGDNVFVAVDPDEEEVQLDVSEPPETARWYYNIGDERHGPVSLMDLRQLLLNGQVSPHDLVWKEGLSDWMPIANQPEFQAQIGGGGRYQPYSPPMNAMAFSPGPHLPRTSGLAVASLTLGVLGLFPAFCCLFALIPVTAAMAVASVILGFIGLFVGVCTVFAITFGAAALMDVGRSRGLVTGRGMALSGLIMGIIGALGWAFWWLFWLHVLTSPFV
jgi:GYF domain 2/Domain of unknown function (DUF4190)